MQDQASPSSARLDVDAMVLCAGLGTRLRPLTLERPKPAVPVANRPLAWFALSHLARVGIHRVDINTHHLPHVLEGELRTHAPPELELKFFHEPVLLGTGGGLRNAWRGDRPLLVMNGDILFAPDLLRLIQVAQDRDAIAAMVLRSHPNPAQFGSVEVDEDGVVRRLLGKPQLERPLQAFMFTGVHYLSPRAHQELPKTGCVIRESYRRWIDRQGTVAAVIDRSPWSDLGTIDTYAEANLALTTGQLEWAGVDRDDVGNIVGSKADIHGAVIRESVIGSEARISAGVQVTQSIVWSGCRVTESIDRRIVTPQATIGW